ncbi:MAG: GAF domain-containing protein [Chloroflexi bacterium]|nr:MAG: GAF domain-containing protein [Chloroflexota bacterium]TMC29422.1 MAG: GAF domain-containing protein [Chloroflexota bacterium]TMC57216.1 MAG: GAF domain-containing protein [Chloroflexota bacterium]
MSVVPITTPVEATLRILLNSVPFLMGAAIVRQPPGSEGVVATIGRMPWLHDRRLTTLQLPDDTLPSNRAVALDWPVPFQAEWIGAPPRLLISRLVFQGRTVGVLLGTLISREPLSQQTREALDLAGELIASAVAGESAAVTAVPPPPPRLEQHQEQGQGPVFGERSERAPEPEPEAAYVASGGTAVAAPPAPPEAPVLRKTSASEVVIDEVRRGLAAATDTRSLGRVLRDAMSAITDASAFSVSVFHLSRQEVAYRYKVVGQDRDSAELGRQHVDDGPASYAARHDRRWHVYARDVAIRDELDAHVREVIVLQVPMSTGGDVFGIVSVQTFKPEGFTDQELRLIATLVEVASPHFAQVRMSGRFQPAAPTPESVTPASESAILPPDAVAQQPERPQLIGANEPLMPPSAPAPQQAVAGSGGQPAPRSGRSGEDVLRDLLRRCGGAGFQTAFLVGVHTGAGALKGELVSDGEAAKELDYALGISAGTFGIPLDDRYNAIARAVREGRIVPAPTLYEITRPATDFETAQKLERLAKGGRSITLPIIVSGAAAGALVIGPMAEDPTFFSIEAVRGYVDDAAQELASMWRKAGA